MGDRHLNSMFIVILLLLNTINSQSTPLCVHTQMHWLKSLKDWPSIMTLENEDGLNMRDVRMCNTTYESMMQIESLKLVRRENMLWLSTFHQYCTAQLNKLKLVNDMIIGMHSGASNNATTAALFQLDNAINIVGDTLERYCQDMASFQQTNDFMLYYYMEALHLFNTGGIQGLPTCNTSSNRIEASSLYYKQLPDLIIIPFIRSNDPNETMEMMTGNHSQSIIDRLLMYSLLDDNYRARAFLLSSCIISYCVIIPALIAVIYFMRDSRRKLLTTLPVNTLLKKGEVEEEEERPSNPLYDKSDTEIELSHVINRDDIITSEINLSTTVSSDNSSEEKKKNV